MNIEVLKLFKPAINTDKFIIDVWGGRGRGGSHFLSQMAVAKLCRKHFFRGYLIRQIHGDIRGSLWRDVMDRLEELNITDLFHIVDNKMELTHKETGNMLLSKGVKKDGSRTAKLKSLAGATDVFIEEADEIMEDDFNQMVDSLRTVKAHNVHVYRCFNPPSKSHWFWKDYQLTKTEHSGYLQATCTNPDILSIFGTYQNNMSFMNAKTIERFENYKTANYEYYMTVVMGYIAEQVRGRIYDNWNIIERSEFDAIDAPILYGVDFGFSDHPLALIAVKIVNDCIYCHELIYESGLGNSELKIRMQQLGITTELIICDAGGQGDTRIYELATGDVRFNCIAAIAGAGSVKAGISAMQESKVFYTRESQNIHNEYQNYRWALDQNKLPTQAPVKKLDDALDAIRYVKHMKNIGMI